MFPIPNTPNFSKQKEHDFPVPGKGLEIDVKYVLHIGHKKDWPHDKVFLKIGCNPGPGRTLRGGCAFFGEPGSGKSSLALHAIASLINSREFQTSDDHIVIVDFSGEWKRKITERNWDSRFDKIALDPSVIQHIIAPNFFLSDFDQENDWTYLGFGIGTSATSYIVKIAVDGVKYHENDPQKMLKMISILPTKPGELSVWNEKYPELEFPQPLHTATVSSLGQHFYELSPYFKEVGDGSPRIKNWVSMLRKKKVTILTIPYKSRSLKNWPLDYASTVLGKIMAYIDEADKINLIWVKEEADYFVNNPEKTKTFLASSYWMQHFVLKNRKKGFWYCLICQLPSSINPEVLKNIPTFIFGNLPRYEMASLLGQKTGDDSLPYLGSNQLARVRFMELKNKLTQEQCKFIPVDAAVNVTD